MPDAWRAYLEMALGLTEIPRKRAQKAVGDLVSRGGATAVQLQGLVEDLLSAGMANREALTNIVRYEVDKALGAVGLATAEEVDELTLRVRDLEKELKAAQAKAVPGNGAVSAVGGTRLERPAPAPKKVAKKAMAKKAVKATPNAMPAAATAPVSPVARKAVAKKAVKKVTPAAPAGTAEAPTAPVKAAAAETVLPAKKASAKKAVAKNAPAKKAVAKKAPAQKAVAKKAVKKAAPTPAPASASAPAPAPLPTTEPKTEPKTEPEA